MKRQTLLILLALVLLGVLPLLICRNKGGEESFSGADAQAEKAISETRPDYEPWFRSLWTPPSKEVESLLFALQAAVGAGVLGYYLGLIRGRAEGRRRTPGNAPD